MSLPPNLKAVVDATNAARAAYRAGDRRRATHFAACACAVAVPLTADGSEDALKLVAMLRAFHDAISQGDF